MPTLVPVVLGCDDSTSTRSLKNMRDARSSARRGDNDEIDELTAYPHRIWRLVGDSIGAALRLGNCAYG
jgi:hypothetical protein